MSEAPNDATGSFNTQVSRAEVKLMGAISEHQSDLVGAITDLVSHLKQS